MKSVIAIIALAVALTSTGKCIPREWVLRNGLTDEQINNIFEKDPNATIHLNAGVWRNVKFNTHRFNNVTNWLGIIGETNDFARLVVPTMATNEIVIASNSVLRTTLAKVESDLEYCFSGWTNQIAQTVSISNQLSIIQGQLAAASAKIQNEIAELEEEKADLEEKIEDTKYILLRPWLKTKLAAVEARIKVLQALTGSN